MATCQYIHILALVGTAVVTLHVVQCSETRTATLGERHTWGPWLHRQSAVGKFQLPRAT